MSDGHFKISVIGLGIIGGSMAYALRGFKNAEIMGCDTDEETRRKALKSGAVDRVTANSREAVENADLVIMCIYPDYIRGIFEKCRDVFKDGAVVTDVCGVKRRLYKKVYEIIPDNVEYISGHPMAGRETDGFDSADKDMFLGCGYIITPMKGETEKGLGLIREMVEYIGAKRITEAPPELHDEIIAYTSDLMHLSASALCLSYNENMNLAYTAGAYRDCTRIANINPELWSELFLENRDNLLNEADRLISSLTKLRNAVDIKDKEEIKRLLGIVRDNKLEMQKREV